MKIKLIGLGGIGCRVLPILTQYLNNSVPGVELWLVDGDNYEGKNTDRQLFERLGNKAEVSTEMTLSTYPDLNLRAEPYFITEENIVTLIREDDIVFLCVDNHATRKLVSDRCGELDNVTLISGSNEGEDALVMVYQRIEGQDHTLPLTSSYHPEIQEPEDRNPGEVGCDRIVASQPQLMFANNLAASLMLNAFYVRLLEGKVGYSEAMGSIRLNSVRPVLRKEIVNQ